MDTFEHEIGFPQAVSGEAAPDPDRESLRKGTERRSLFAMSPTKPSALRCSRRDGRCFLCCLTLLPAIRRPRVSFLPGKGFLKDLILRRDDDLLRTFAGFGSNPSFLQDLHDLIGEFVLYFCRYQKKKENIYLPLSARLDCLTRSGVVLSSTTKAALRMDVYVVRRTLYM